MSLLPWLQFAASAALIGFAEPALIHYGDVTARTISMSQSLIGLVLIAPRNLSAQIFNCMSTVTVAIVACSLKRDTP